MKIRFIIATCFGLAACQSPNAWSFQTPAQAELPNYDKRADAVAAPTANERQAAAELKARVPGVKIERDKILGVPRLISAQRGFLSGVNGKGRAVNSAHADALPANDPHRSIKAFVNEHSALFGHNAQALASARLTRDYVTEHNGLRTVVWQQTLDDVPVFEGVFMGHVTRNGELVSISSRFIPDADKAATAGLPNRKAALSKPKISAAQAVALAARNLGSELETGSLAAEGSASGAEKLQTFNSKSLRGEARAQLRWLPMNRDSMRLCWRVELTTRTRPELYSALVDVETGEVLVRRCLTAYIQAASYNVYTSDSPSPFSPGLSTPSSFQPPVVPRQLVTFGALSTNASPNGWINDNVNETRGNNVDAHTDKEDNDLPDLPRPQGVPNRVFNFPLDLAQSPTTYSDASVVNLFYWNNFMHDRLYELGFTEAAGNFQNTNFNKGGFGNDAVQADAQDGGGFNNANFSTPPDGFPGRMQMYLFDGPSPDRDGDLDAEVMCHEYAHGLSNRLVGGGVGISALQSAGMGEGWSDFYGVALLGEPGDDVHANFAVGGYVTFQFFGLNQNYYYGIRRYPYSTDMNKNPLTFKDIDPAQADPHPGIPINPIFGGGNPAEVHNQGEVWCVTLWEARAALIDKSGFAIGNNLILRLVTDGMKLAPPNPTFLEARDAIITADDIYTGGDNYSDLWIAFAKRGMGFSASSPGSETTDGVVEAFDVPDDVSIGIQDGILEVRITPVSGSAIFAPSSQQIFIRVTDGVAVTNATITATINGTNLVFRNDGVLPDLSPNNAIYSALFDATTNFSSVMLTAIISAPGKDTATNVVTYSIIPIPSNDNFTNAVKVPPTGATYVSNNKLATTESGEPAHAGVASASSSLWWSFAPTNNVSVLVDTAGSLFNSIVAVYTNATLATLGEVVSADDVGARQQAYVTFDAKLGTTYRIAVASFATNSTGTLNLRIAPNGTPDTNAPALSVSSPLSGLTVGTNRVLVTGTAVDPEPGPSGINDIQIRVNPGGAVYTIDGRVSSIITSSNWSRQVGLNEGLNIIQVNATDVAGNRSPTITLQVTYRPLDPANDLFVNAIVLTNNADVSSVNSTLATKEFGEPNHAGNIGGKSVWWRFTPAEDGLLALTTTNSTFDTVMGLYTGGVVGGLTNISANDDAYSGAPGGFSAISQAVRSNRTYSIAVDGFDGASGVVFLDYSFTPSTVYNVSVSATGGGSVTPGSGDAVSNSTVVLTATPNSFFVFAGWTGSFISSDNPLSFVVNSNINLTANFQPASFSDDFETGNFLKLGWITSGNVPWSVQTNTVITGTFAARSGAIGHSQTSSLLLTTNFAGGAGSFYYKVSSEPGWDYFRFYVDGGLVQQASGEVDWQQYPFSLNGGTHTLEWRYVKDANNSAGSDAAFIDNVNLPFSVAIDGSTPARLEIVRQPGGNLLVHVQGQTNQQYVIQGATDFIPPISWQSISTNIATNGVIDLVVPDVLASPMRFYRAVVIVP